MLTTGQPIGATVHTFRQIKYILFPDALLDLYQALSGAWVVCGRDLHKQLIEFGGAVKVCMSVQVEYEPVNPIANKQFFEQYLNAAPTRILRRDETVSAFGNPYIDLLRILTDKIREFNAKFIHDKSDLRLARVLQFTLKIKKYAPLEGGGWQPLSKFLEKKKAIINIHNDDERCFGYAVLYFLDRQIDDHRHENRANLYSEEIFERNGLVNLPYPIGPNDVQLYEDQLQININVFSFFDNEGRARHQLVISQKNYDCVANILYWKQHYAPITSIPRLFSDITKHNHQKHFCLRCLGHFSSEEVLARTRSSVPETT